MQPIRFLTTQLSSDSLRKLSESLSLKLGYKVWRSPTLAKGYRHLRYGDGKDKLYQYKWFDAYKVPSLPFTTDASIVQQWLEEGKTVFARTLLNASEGKGIVVLTNALTIVPSQVYTQYLPHKKEFRVHVFGGQVVAVLEKRKKIGGFTGQYKIRNSANGYVFCRNDVVEPEGIRELALAASKMTNSHFAGVDIGYNEKDNHLFVIEVNSAPGMENSTVEDYAQVICASL